MKLFESIADWQAFRKTAIFNEKTLGFIPTMGNLHAGHQSLLKCSIGENDFTVLSIFINPTQFNDPKDLEKYPRTLEQDLLLAQETQVDFVLLPDFKQIYPDAYRYKVTENTLSQQFCGKFRPGHFDGVLTIVLKLLLLVKANKAYFGEKDYQQWKLIHDMAKAFFIETEIIPCPIMRDSNGLALSSRNQRLSREEQIKASELYQLLISTLTIPEIQAQLKKKGFDVEYLEDYEGRRLAAVKLGEVRLIDNIALPL
ncbi:MAG: Pantothenate synthetase [Legionellaceae bacterium]